MAPKDVILAAGLIGLAKKGPNENSRHYVLDRWRQGLSSYRLLCEGSQEYSPIHQRKAKALKQASFDGVSRDRSYIGWRLERRIHRSRHDCLLPQ